MSGVREVTEFDLVSETSNRTCYEIIGPEPLAFEIFTEAEK